MCNNFSDEERKTLLNPFLPSRYSPLSSCQIRNLKLLAGQNESPLELSLNECCLSAMGYGYEALSYVWGSPKPQVSIIYNEAELMITRNVKITLYRLRYREKPRILWVDAICIIQEGFGELAHQVLLMKKIYLRADRVLAWLREGDKYDKLAFKAIDELVNFNRQYRRQSDAIQVSKLGERFASKPGYHNTLEAVGRMVYQSLFNRCWTFQEILFSTEAELLLGEFWMRWHCFYYALQAFNLNIFFENILNFYGLFMCHGAAKIKNTASTNSDSYPVSQNLSIILQMTRNFTAIDPRDKIFSLLSISATRNPFMFEPDYRISTRETCISWTFAMIQDENSLNVITNCGEKKRDKSLPSWCPDWACKRSVTQTGYYDYISYDVSAGLKPCFENLEMKDRFELELEGAAIDIVDKTYNLEALIDELRASAKNGSFKEVLSKLVRKKGLKRYLVHNRLSPEAVLLRTLNADHWFFGTHLQGSSKEHWFPAYSQFQDLERNKCNSLTPNIVIYSRKEKSLSSNDKYRRIINSRPPLDVSKMRSMSIHVYGGSGVNFDNGPEAEHRDYEIEG